MVECGGPGLVPGVGSCTKLPHSLSAGEVSRGHNSSNPLPPPTITNSTKMLAIRVRMLDDNVTLFQVQAKALGKVLFEQVCKQLNLLEADYFGLEYQDDAGIKYWLDLEKCLQRQVGLSLVEPLLQFCVKFYPADPTQLEEEYTRYLFCLQVKRDLAQGHIQCNDNTAALMASYIVQAECGDFVAEDYPDPSYLSTYKFVQHQDKELERKIMENHKKHIGQSPAEADLNLLETARRCELYGVKMHPAKDHDGVALNLAVAHMGILVFINYNKINSFSWAKIRKISFKRKKFLIKLHAEGYGYHKDTVEFFFDTRNECKNLWKKCVEHHGFFRCSSVKRTPRQRARVLSRGSSFRYSGRTQKQIVEFVRENYVKRQTFQRSSPLSRSQSFRQSSSVHSSVANVGSSISAHPLIPLANASIVSMSCGSMAGDFQNQTCHVDQTTVSPSIQPLQPHATTHTVAIVEKSSTRSSSPELVSNGPLSNIENNNSIMPVSPTSKMNGGYISSEYASPELSPMKTVKEKSYGIDSSDSEVKKKRYSNDRAYFIAKEFLMTERTYRKDLEVINLCVREELGKAEWDCIKHLLSIIDPLHDEHCHLLKELELRLAAWENRGSNHHKLADLLLAATHLLPLYEDFLQQHQTVLIELNKELADESFKEAYSNFEKIKLCYLPITRFILKPIQRLLHYEHLVDSLINHYGKDHADFCVCEKAKLKLEEVTKHIPDILRESENYIHLIELSRDISGFEGDLTEGDRQFIRQGSLAKFSQRKGYQQRMFFLFSDLVLYSNLRGQTFRLHGQMSLKNLTVQERVDNPSPNSFIIYTGNRALTVSANSQLEKDKWLEDLSCAIESSKENPLPSVSSLHSLKCSNSMEDVVDGNAQDNQRATPQRSNTTVHVCWHRNTSICLNDLIRASENQLSGYLLRKFKNSNGWQKLWVVFTNFCLFFYKTFQDEAPLASLPLLGYSVTTPIQEDGINKDFVFKLQFKNHIYFFRAESEYTFGRWMEVIGSATQHSGRLRIFSRKESDIQNNI